ncbi:MAG: Gfo/Idh/MocA family oxidoreductase, partial [Acidobacteriota bacterium]
MGKNIALIGAGNWGKNHLRNLYNLGALHSVLELSNEIIEIRKKDYADIPFTQDEKDILDNEEIKGVVIAAPAHLHFKLAKKYLLAGKDVLVEKPLALNVEEGEELVKIAEDNRRILMVGHILQYHYAVKKLKEIIDEGVLGKIRYIYSNRLNIGKLRSEENVLWSFAPHDISLILMLLNGEEPENISAFGGAYINKNIFDTTLTTLEFGSGV